MSSTGTAGKTRPCGPSGTLKSAQVCSEEDTWSHVGRGAPDSPEVLAAYVKAIRWRSATAADRDLLQAPFRAGIRLDAYQLLPLRKALRLPRVNLLIADDVGLGKTVEAGLFVRELLLRRRIDYIVISAPAAMTVQWKDELESKFGLTFDIVDRERIHELRRVRGFSVNAWTTGSRFIFWRVSGSSGLKVQAAIARWCRRRLCSMVFRLMVSLRLSMVGPLPE
jgi:hypothetical protein